MHRPGVRCNGSTRIDISQVDASFTILRGFVHVAGNTIFLANQATFEGTGKYWVGTIDAE